MPLRIHSLHIVTAAAIVLYYIFLFYQSYIFFVEFQKARRAYFDKKIEKKPSVTRMKYGTENISILSASRW